MGKKHRKKIHPVDESNAKLFVSKFLKDHSEGKISNSELESSILKLFLKFPVTEVMSFLPSNLILSLRKISEEEEQEDNFIFYDSFGPEFDCQQYLSSYKKNFNEVKKRLFLFFKKNKI